MQQDLDYFYNFMRAFDAISLQTEQGLLLNNNNGKILQFIAFRGIDCVRNLSGTRS